ncbi:F0F1 ATP synthase subunit delta [Geminicoccaceae bacterium 1502E]|uniref:ATP synthase subunit delta n=1 Tax=Marinimicrococcus flavescens TaxID=3031815 RepID=A0AAP3XRR0_9PROT|nr:F0F1 ATP synthase subunit delta [Marinimicrococcus flavescens]MDX6749450.1 F0F1 ATP synthase subunit delta [Geminicoccaceae bacterium 1502E]
MPAKSATASGLASRYATALFELAREQNKLDEVASDLDGVVRLLDESADMERLIKSPVLSREEQERAVVAIADRAGLRGLVRNFLGVLAQKRRLFALRTIVAAFRGMLAEHRGEATAEVVSATPLDERQMAAIKESVASFAGKAVSLTSSVDPSLLAGVVVRVGSRMIDASLKAKLQQLELSMKGVG